MKGRRYCDTCQAVQRQKKKKKECVACKNRLEVDPEIKRYIDVFTLCDRQLRVAFGGAYALDWGVVTMVARAHHLPIDRRFFDLLRLFDLTMISHLSPPKVPHA